MKESTEEWNGALLSSVMRVRSVCMRVMDLHVYGVGLAGVTFRSAFSTKYRSHLWLHGVEGHQLQFAVIFGVSAK